MSVISRSTSLAGRPFAGRPAVTCFILMMSVVTGASAASPARAAGATNASVTIQLLWQAQQGCASHCTGTSQTQTAVQTATVLQIAASSDAGAGATNASAVLQLIVQTQLGCVAFCTSTTRVQFATQHADTTQLATAIAGALASNSGTVSQLVWQYQDVCLEACDDVSAQQVVDQAAANVQDASADARAGAAVADGPPLPPELQSFMTWLATVAGGVAVDVVADDDVAGCLHDCNGDAQVQINVQVADVVQTSIDGDVVEEAPAAAATTVAAAVPTVAVTAGASPAATTRATVVPRRAAITKHRGKARRPGHRGRWSAIRHRRPPTGGIQHAR